VPIGGPSPGLRVFLLVVLSVTSLIGGVFVLAGVLAVASGPVDSSSIFFLLAGVAVFGIALAATIGVARRSRWARGAAILAGIAVSLTCLGLILGIPILVAAARAPLARKAVAPPAGLNPA
jgi:hypothetical protein